MRIRDIVAPLEEFAPLAWQEEYDNSGLVVGRADDEVEGALICVDATPEVLDEAERLGVRLIIAHHPVIFRPIKRLNGAGHVEQVVERAIRSGVALYACHTNLDCAPGGMSFRLADILGIEGASVLEPAGVIGLKPEKKIGNQPSVKADCSEPAACTQYGFGVIGTLEQAVRPIDYLQEVQWRLGAKVIRHSELSDSKISRVAVSSGSAAALIPAAREAGAELFMGADFKYNDFFAHGASAPMHPFMVADIGHFESEFCAIDLIVDVISKKITNFALHKSANSRNPVSYLL